MKIPIILLLIVLCALSDRLQAQSDHMGQFVCPIEGNKFESFEDLSGTSFGSRLDLKKVGPIPQPWAIPDCPQCRFVIFKEGLDKETIAKLKPYILSPAYQEYKATPSYYRAAKILEFLDNPASVVGWQYLQASWQCENNKKMNRKCLEMALQAYEQVEKKSNNDADHLIDLYLVIEIRRRLSAFDQAMKSVEKMPADFPLKLDWLYDMVPYQKALIQAADSTPHNMDEAPDNPRRMGVKIEEAHKVKGFENLPESIEFYRLNITREKISCGMNFSSNRLINTATWDADLAHDDSPDWNDFLQTIDRAEKLLAPQKWLSEWRQKSKDNRIELRVYGDHFRDGEDMHEWQTWRALKLKGDPKLEFIIRKPGGRWNALLIGDQEPKAMMTSARHRGITDGEWFEKIDFSLFFSQDVNNQNNLPDYILVEPLGSVTTNIPEVEAASR